MTCEEVHEHLHSYFDGELPEEQVRHVESALAECPECQTDLDELVAMRAMMQESLVEPTRETDFSGFANQVMARIENEEAVEVAPAETSAEEPGFLELLAAWFTPPRLAGACAMALAAAFVWWPNAPSETTEPSASETIAATSSEGTEQERRNRRRPMETETSPPGRHAASVESWEVAQGRVEIDQNTDDPTRPLVVWHIVDEEGAPPVDTGL